MTHGIGSAVGVVLVERFSLLRQQDVVPPRETDQSVAFRVVIPVTTARTVVLGSSARPVPDDNDHRADHESDEAEPDSGIQEILPPLPGRELRLRNMVGVHGVGLGLRRLSALRVTPAPAPLPAAARHLDLNPLPVDAGLPEEGLVVKDIEPRRQQHSRHFTFAAALWWRIAKERERTP